MRVITLRYSDSLYDTAVRASLVEDDGPTFPLAIVWPPYSLATTISNRRSLVVRRRLACLVVLAIAIVIASYVVMMAPLDQPGSAKWVSRRRILKSADDRFRI